MIDKPFSKGREPSGTCSVLPHKEMLCHIHSHCCKADGMLPPSLSVPWVGAGTSWVVCRGGKYAVMLWPGLGRSPCMSPMGDPAVQRYTVPLATPALFHFREGSRNVPDYPLHQKGYTNNCPVCVYHSLDNFPREEKSLQRVYRNQ